MTTTLGERTGAEGRSLVPLARLPVLLVAATAALLLLAFSGRYGYFGDELYFIIAGRELSWGYADQPPLVPLLALLMDTLAPGSLTALRLPSIVAIMLGILFAALIAREMGGDRRAQILTAIAQALAITGSATTLATPVFDAVAWTALGWLVARWVRTRSEGRADDRILLAAGVVVAIGLQVKFQIAVFVLALLLATLLVGPRDLLRRPMLWAAAGIATVTTTPTLIWQATNGWPQLGMSEAVAAETALIGPWINLLLMLTGMGIGIGLILGFYGGWRLFTAPELREYRFLVVALVLVVIFFAITNGRSYYVMGAFPPLLAAGAVGFQGRRERKLAEGKRTWGWMAWPAIAVSILASVQALPIHPVESFAGKPFNIASFIFLGQIGWPQATDTVAKVYRSLPPEQRANTGIVTNDYWMASAIRFYGPDQGLPDAYSGARGFWYFGRPPENQTTVIHVGPLSPGMKEHFGEIRQVATLDNGMDIAATHQGHPVFVATDRDASWERIWPDFRRINLAN